MSISSPPTDIAQAPELSEAQDKGGVPFSRTLSKHEEVGSESVADVIPPSTSSHTRGYRAVPPFSDSPPYTGQTTADWSQTSAHMTNVSLAAGSLTQGPPDARYSDSSLAGWAGPMSAPRSSTSTHQSSYIDARSPHRIPPSSSAPADPGYNLAVRHDAFGRTSSMPAPTLTYPHGYLYDPDSVAGSGWMPDPTPSSWGDFPESKWGDRVLLDETLGLAIVQTQLDPRSQVAVGEPLELGNPVVLDYFAKQHAGRMRGGSNAERYGRNEGRRDECHSGMVVRGPGTKLSATVLIVRRMKEWTQERRHSTLSSFALKHTSPGIGSWESAELPNEAFRGGALGHCCHRKRLQGELADAGQARRIEEFRGGKKDGVKDLVHVQSQYSLPPARHIVRSRYFGGLGPR
ncbi:hypothetical protein FB451DRAFT_1178570 [Mycena latifolia]|nr:hypothetical protein FB451DRAFT_1178570 [Mycena latifolia]